MVIKQIDNNLFKHADKELVMDAFLCWLIQEAEENPNLSGFKEDFVGDFLQMNLDPTEHVILKADKQTNNIDIIVNIETSKDKQFVIFENKMWSGASRKQLETYKKKYRNATKYIFFKLGYINSKDKEVSEDAGYIVKNAEQFKELLDNYADKHLFIKEFNEFLLKRFIEPQNEMEKNYRQNKVEKLKNASFQQYVMDKIYEQLLKSDFERSALNFEVGANKGGSPWTQLTFSSKKNIYGENTKESLFFRIDRRAKKYYLRVNLYSTQEDDSWTLKQHRRNKLREVANNVTEELRLNPGKVHNNAKYESEILIFFFEKGNTLESLVADSAVIARKLKEAHQNLE